MNQIKMEKSMLVIVIVLLFTAFAISSSIIYVSSADNPKATSFGSLISANTQSAADIRHTAELPESIERSEQTKFEMPYGAYEPIPDIMDINEYLTLHHTVLSPELSLDYITPSGTKEDAARIMAKIKQLSDEICDGCTDDYSKVYALAVWTGQNIAYDFDAANSRVDLSITSLEAIFNNGMKTTCAGFSNFFSALCHSQGIYCLNLKGGSSSEGWTRATLKDAPANHEWNAVVIDGKWYYTDCTWISDLGVENGSYSGGSNIILFYALMDFEQMSIEHRIDRSEYRCYDTD